MSITYQQAKRIRKSSLSGLIADQLLYEKGIGAAVKKAISLKTRGTLMGITQKFDPLNIAKFLTFGSSLGPALLGQITGRDPRDIAYFTGRLKPIRENTAARIGRAPSGGASGDLNGILRKVYTLMKASHEDEVKRLELSKNLDEEKQLEEKKRHIELLEAITGRAGRTAVPMKQKGAGLFGTIMNMIGDAIKGVKDWVENFLSSFDFKKILSSIFGGSLFQNLLKFLGGPIFRFLFGFASIPALILGLAELLKYAVSKVDNMNVKTPEQAAFILATASEYDIENGFGGEESLKDIITNGAANAQKILDTGDEELISKSGGREFLQKSAQQTNVKVPTERNRLQKVEPRPDTDGGTKNLQRARDWDIKFGDKFYPNGTRRTEIPQDESFNNAEMAKLQRQASGPSGVPVSNTDNLGAKLDTSQSENLSGRMTEGKLIRAAATQTNETNVTKSVKGTPVKKALPSVRNHEESFSRMIFDSTRVV
jgi:hypothetical protein